MKMTFYEKWVHLPYKLHALFIGMILVGLLMVILPSALLLGFGPMELIFLVAGFTLSIFSLIVYILKSHYQPEDLYGAVGAGNLRLVQWLTDQARNDRRLIPYQNMLDLAVKAGHLDIAKWLMDQARGDRRLTPDQYTLFLAVKAGRVRGGFFSESGIRIELEDAAVQYGRGMCYAGGTGVTKDEAKAVRWYSLAANQGYAPAQTNLGMCYAGGTGVTKDEAKAVRWYSLAANQGYAPAQTNLGMCYAGGTGVTKDEAKAVYWYAQAAKQGDEDAQNNLKLLLDANPNLARQPSSSSMGRPAFLPQPEDKGGYSNTPASSPSVAQTHSQPDMQQGGKTTHFTP